MNPTCKADHCSDEAVSGGEYCENHLIQQQIAEHPSRPKPMGTLAQMIRNAKGKGLIANLGGEYQGIPS